MESRRILIQSLLLRWFRHHGTRSISQIRIACRALNESFCEDVKDPLHSFFSPLIRKGHVEFIGNDRYQPALPVIIFNQKENISTAINLSCHQVDLLQKKYGVGEPDAFGVIRFESRLNEINKICTKYDIPYVDHHISHVLNQFPNLKDAVLQFREEFGVECRHYFNPFKRRWEKVESPWRQGIYKVKEDARQYYFRLDQNKWFKMPSFRSNPDAWHICNSYQAMANQNDTPFIFYQKAKHTVIVDKISIPILIDRILRIPSIHIPAEMEMCYPNISPSAFKQLNRIFLNGIEVNE